MSNIIDFKLSAKEYIDLSQKANENGDIEKRISYLFKALTAEPSNAQAMIMLADAYAEINAFEISNDWAFKAMRAMSEQDSSGELFEQIHVRLSLNYLELGRDDVAEYYMRDIAQDYDFCFDDDDGTTHHYKEKLHVGYPHDNEYYEALIDEACKKMDDHDLDGALDLLNEVDENSQWKRSADHIALICLMMKHDLDRVIETAKAILKKRDSDLSTECTLATAYAMEKKMDECQQVLDHILSKEYYTPTKIHILLPLLVTVRAHEQIEKYTYRIMQKTPPEASVMLWRAQALYNLGRREEAMELAVRVRNIFGKYSDGNFYVKLFASEPESVPYVSGLPLDEKFARYKRLESLFHVSSSELETMLSKDVEEWKELIDWFFQGGNEDMLKMLLVRLTPLELDYLDDFLREELISSNLTFDLIALIVFRLSIKNRPVIKFDVVADGRYKSVKFVLPEAYDSMPMTLFDAINFGIANIIYNDETPNVFLHRLTAIVNSVVSLDENGKLRYASKQRAKIKNLTSMKTMLGVIFAQVYKDDDEDSVEDTIKRFGINRRLFDKYNKIFFGDEDGK